MKVRTEKKESQLLNHIKLHMAICVPFCRMPYPFESSSIFLLPSLRFEKPSKSYNCQRENAENRCLRRPPWAFSRSVKLIARYYSHSIAWTVIRPDASRITTVRCPRMRQRCFSARLKIVLKHKYQIFGIALLYVQHETVSYLIMNFILLQD